MLDHSGWNLKLNKGKSINMGGLSSDKEFTTLVVTLRDGVNSLLGWLLEAWESYGLQNEKPKCQNCCGRQWVKG